MTTSSNTRTTSRFIKLLDCPIYEGVKKSNRKGVINDDVPCFVTEESPNDDAVHPKYCEAVVEYWGSTETESRTEHRGPGAVLTVNEKTVTPDPFILEEFSQPREEDTFCKELA